jgi:RND family efflux transporter MFP subunit
MKFMCYRFGCLLGLFVIALVIGCGGPPPVVPPVPPKVTVSIPLVREVSDYEEFTGYTDAASTVDIRARVSGYLIKVNFRDGDVVKQGDLLYQIDPRPFQATLDQAKGEVESLEAKKIYLDVEVKRYKTLIATSATSQKELDDNVAQQAENVGTLKTARAKVDAAALNLEFTRITAPIGGRISRTFVTEGNLVAADSTLLTTIRSIDPMYAYFNVEEPAVLRIQKMIREGIIKTRNDREIHVQMGLADDTARKFPLHGILDFTNNTIDPQTGTLQVRGTFANPYTFPGPPPVLTPGLFVRVRLAMGPPHRTLLLTEQAIGTDQGQKFVYVIDAENKVEYHRVTLGQTFDGLQAIEEGLEPNQRVVVNGLQRIRPGLTVVATQVDMASLATPAAAASPPAMHSAVKPAATVPHLNPIDPAPVKPAAGGPHS